MIIPSSSCRHLSSASGPDAVPATSLGNQGHQLFTLALPLQQSRLELSEVGLQPFLAAHSVNQL